MIFQKGSEENTVIYRSGAYPQNTFPRGSVTIETIPVSIGLDEDVRQYFTNTEAVNEALRGLIELITEKSKSSGPAM
jgi:hypothetical protein